MRKERLFITLFFIFVASLLGLVPRYKVESKNKAVGLCLEMSVVRETSATTRRPILNILQDLKRAGLNYVVLSEDNLGDLILQGTVKILEGKKIFSNPYFLQRIQQSLKLRYKIDLPISKGMLDLGNNEIDFKNLKNLGLGVSEKDALLLKQSQLKGIARHSNFYGSYPFSIKQTLSRSKQLGIDYYLPENDQVLGFKGNLNPLVNSLKELDMFYVSPEFAKMQGDTTVGTKIPERTIRLHSAQIAELEKMDYEYIVERYVRAYKERNIRFLLIRPHTASNENTLSTLTNIMLSINHKINKTGGKVGYAKPFSFLSKNSYSFLILMVILSGLRFPKKETIFPIGMCLGVISTFQPSYVGILVAIFIPLYGYYLIANRFLEKVWWKYGIWSLTSLIGGTIIANLGNSLAHMLHFIPFPGVKLVQIVPILGIGVWVFHNTFSLKKIWEASVQWRGLILFLLVLGVLGLMLIRSGNDNPSTVSSLELSLRSILDTLLYVRPRTKEFLIGHPALWIGLSFMPFVGDIKDRFDPIKKYISIGGVVLGTIGQVSIINTFCHFHTPLSVTFSRVFIGLALGALIGQLGVIGLKYFFKKYA